MGKRTIDHLMVAAVLILTLSTAAPGNVPQRSIANVGINLGCLASFIERFGVTAENAAMINFWIDAALADLDQIIAGYRAPFDPEGVRQVAESLRRFEATTDRWNNQQRGAFFQGLHSRLGQQFSQAYESRRGIFYCATCDTFVLNFGYHYGRAWIGAWVNDPYLHNSGRSGMNLAMTEGRRCAESLLCSFPVLSMWAGLNLQDLRTNEDYRRLVGQVLDVITVASLAEGPLPEILVPSSPRAAPAPPAGQSLEGTWRSEATGDVIRFQRQGEILRGHIAQVGRSALFRVGDLMGEFRPLGAGAYDGKLALKQADGNVGWLDGVRITVHGATATATAPWWNVPVTYTRVAQ